MKHASSASLALAFILVCSNISFGKTHESTGKHSENNPFEIQYFEKLPEHLFPKSLPPTPHHSLSASEGIWSFEAFGRRFRISLSPHSRLLRKLSHQKRTHVERTMKFFQGTLTDIPGSWVRLTRIGQNWSGMIWDGKEAYIIDALSVISPALQTVPNESPSGHAIYRISDTRDLETQACGVGKSGSMPGHSMSNFGTLMGELQDRLGTTAQGATRNLDMTVVTDEAFNQTNTHPEEAVIARMNVVDGIFSEQLNVQISLVDILPLQHNGGLTSTNALTLLNQFSAFTSAPSFEHPGIAHLFTGRDLDGNTVGYAFLRSLCNPQFGIGVNQIIGTGTAGALIVAHELGHNFGAPHDNEIGSPCASTPGSYLMNPYIDGSDQFSPCSLSQIQPVISGASCLTVIHLEQADLQSRFQPSPLEGPLKQPFTSTLTVTNYGQGQALNPTASMVIPQELTVDHIYTDGGSCMGINTTHPTCRLDPIPPGEERLITLTLKATTIGSFTLQATVSADNESATANNTARGIITIDNGAPHVAITTPQDGAFLFSTTTVTFSAQAQDAENGDLTADIVWTSDQDGQLGTGGTLTAPLSPGLHTIRASATDLGGETTTEIIMISVISQQSGTMLFEAHFDNDRDQLRYVDDAFRNTREPHYASGTLELHSGFSKGGLRVQLGGLDHADVLGMSGGWRRRLTLKEPQMVMITFRMKLTQASNYEPDEYSEALFSVNDRLIGINQTDVLAQLTGNGNGGHQQTTGWMPIALAIGKLEAGTHHITIGAFNNKKTYQDETTEMLLDDVAIRGLPVISPPSPDANTLLSANFDKGRDGFSFMPDLFKRTRHPFYAHGMHLPTGGFSGGGLHVFLGGRNNRNIWGMSGGWKRQFTVTSSKPITLTFRYLLTQARNYEPNEISDALVSIDGRLRSPSRSKRLARLRGDGNGGKAQTTGWTQVTIKLGRLSPGQHTLAIGAYNNRKTYKNESTEMLIDDVLIKATQSDKEDRWHTKRFRPSNKIMQRRLQFPRKASPRENSFRLHKYSNRHK